MAFGEPLRGMLRGAVLGDMGSSRRSHTEKGGHMTGALPESTQQSEAG